MKANNEPWCNGTRIKLADVLPLETPITIGIEASSYCNLKCSYCAHGVEVKTFPQQYLSFTSFVKAIDSLSLFNDKIKNIVFAVNGEPLTNKKLPDMIKYIKEHNVSEKVTVFTNAVLLSEEFSQLLIDAGLDILRVSIQGVSDERYLELCDTAVSYRSIVENVKAFYEYRNKVKSSCHIFVKIVDQSFKSPQDEEKFYADFGDICDQISIETIVPMRLEVDYDKMQVNTQCNLIKQNVEKSDVCSQPFYAMYVRSNGNVTACCITDANNLVIGNIEHENLYEIWNGDKIKDIRKIQLKRERYSNSICCDCNYPKCGMHINDKIDHIAQRLYKEMME